MHVVKLLQCQAARHGQLVLVRDANLATGEEQERKRETEREKGRKRGENWREGRDT